MSNNAGNINVNKGKSWLPKFLADLFDGTDENIGEQLGRNAPPALGRNLTKVLGNEGPASELRANAPEYVPAAARGLNPEAPEFVPAPAQGGRRKTSRRSRKARRSMRKDRSRKARRASRSRSRKARH